jgi:hypothetical protein
MDRPNYLALEPLLTERLSALKMDWPELRLATSGDLGDKRDDPGGLPAVWLLYMGDRNIPDGVGNGLLITCDQVWCVAVAVRDLRSASESRAAAGELIAATLGLVQGWTPPQAEMGTYGPLLRTAAPAPIVGKGVMITPLYFTCRVKSRGAI